MRVSPREVAELREEILRELPALASLEAHVVSIAGRVIAEAGKFNAELEQRIEESGKMPGDAVVTLMIQGALTEIFEGLPEDNVRRHLFRAGRLVGKLMSRKYREKIAAAMTQKMGGN